MAINIVDRRGNTKGKSSENRQRLLKRIKGQVKDALPGIIKNTNIEDITSPKGKIKVPVKGLDDPHFQYDKSTGRRNNILPGNEDYAEGDTIKKEKGGKGGGKGKGGSNDPTVTEDDFFVSITKEEFLDYFFDDLELPDLVKKQLNTITDFKMKKSGFTNQGSPNRLSVTKSYKNSLVRKMASNLFFDKKIKEIEGLLLIENDEEKIKELTELLEKYKKMKNSIPFMEEIDLRYNNYEKIPVPTTSAVMICIMDVSASMTEFHKDMGKRFFMLLYLFLTKQYEKIEIVFIRHHTEAKEVDENEFFNSKESGGTIVNNALKLAKEIIETRYLSGHNIYLTQISDGDVWDSSDSIRSRETLSSILKNIQWGWYVEVSDMMENSRLMSSYEDISSPNFNMGVLYKLSDIWPLFKEFFAKK